jgi:hypothetical protein
LHSKLSFYLPASCLFYYRHSRKAWKFSLVGLYTVNDEYHKYTPHSDFHLSIRGLPHIIVEALSHDHEKDRYRMLIQASCVVRYVNSISNSASSFVMMAIYITKTAFDRYLVYQPDKQSPEVYELEFSLSQCSPPTIQIRFCLDTYELRTNDHNVIFLLELWNYASVAHRLSGELGNPRADIDALKIPVKLKSFHTKSKKKRRREADEDEDEDEDTQSPPGPSRRSNRLAYGSVFDDPIVRAKLSSAGYHVAEAWVDPDICMEPLDRVRQVIARYYTLTSVR